MESKEETIENWLGWLKKRIPELKQSHNEFWVKQALLGCNTELSESKPKPKTKPIELRKQQFKVDVLKHSDYGEIMLDEFIDYWTEHNENGRKMKFEMQKTFNIKLRLKQWHKRSRTSATKSNGVNQAWQ